MKESLFNIIASRIPGASVLDLFSGTGSLGIEALSRGASKAVFVDMSRECANIISQNLTHTKLSEKASVITGNVSSALKRPDMDKMQFDIIFMDPPYNKNLVQETLEILASGSFLYDGGLVAVERSLKDNVPERFGDLVLIRNQKYGDTVLTFYEFDKQ